MKEDTGVISDTVELAVGSSTTLPRPIKFVFWGTSYSSTTSSSVNVYAYIPVFIPSTGQYFIVNGSASSPIVYSTQLDTSTRTATFTRNSSGYSSLCCNVVYNSTVTKAAYSNGYLTSTTEIYSIKWSADLKTIQTGGLHYRGAGPYNINGISCYEYSSVAAKCFIIY